MRFILPSGPFDWQVFSSKKKKKTIVKPCSLLFNLARQCARFVDHYSSWLALALAPHPKMNCIRICRLTTTAAAGFGR